MVRDSERDFHRLVVIQTRINLALVSSLEIWFAEIRRTTDAFSHIITSQFQMDSAQNRSTLGMDFEALL